MHVKIADRVRYVRSLALEAKSLFINTVFHLAAELEDPTLRLIWLPGGPVPMSKSGRR